MSDPSESPESDTAVQTTLEENLAYVGLVTRVISWVVDVLLINLVAIITGLGAQLIASIFPITKDLKPVFLAIAAGVYVVWAAGLLRRVLVDVGSDAGFPRDAGPVGDSRRGEGQARPGAGALDRDERRVGAVALGLRTDPVQAPGIPGLARPHACDRGPTAVYRRSASGEDAGDTQELPTTLSTR